MSRTKRKPHDPAATAKAHLERIEREAEIARLQSQGVIVALDNRRHIISARRSNVFRLLLERRSITESQYDAAYRLSLDWAAWKGLDGKPDGGNAGYVDGGGGCREIVTDRMIKAGRDVVRAMADVPPIENRLIRAFMVSTVEEDRPMAWRGLVMRETGELVRDRQTQLVVGALEFLRQAYEGPSVARKAVMA